MDTLGVLDPLFGNITSLVRVKLSFTLCPRLFVSLVPPNLRRILTESVSWINASKHSRIETPPSNSARVAQPSLDSPNSVAASSYTAHRTISSGAASEGKYFRHRSVITVAIASLLGVPGAFCKSCLQTISTTSLSDVSAVLIMSKICSNNR